MARSRGFLEWPFFEPAHRELAVDLDAWAGARLANRVHREDRASVDAACRELVGELGRDGWTRYCAPSAPHGSAPESARRRRGIQDVRALALIRETLARAVRRSGRLCVRHAGFGQRTDLPRRFSRAAGAVSASKSRRGGPSPPSPCRSPIAGSDVAAIQLRSARLDADSVCTGRREDLDFERRHRRPLLRVRADQPGRASFRGLGGRRGYLRFRGRCGNGRVRHQGPHRGHRAPSNGHTLIRRLPYSRGTSAGPRGTRLQAGHAHSGYIPNLGRRGSPRLCTARARRGAGVFDPEADVRQDPGRPAADPCGAGPTLPPRSMRRDCSPTGRRGSGTGAAALRKKSRWRRWPPPSLRNAP